MSDSLIGKQLGDYLIRDLLGRGGMARVYRGYDARLDRLAAVKVINNDFSPADRVEYFERFQREARSIARLNHPNIVGIYQFGQYEDSYYMAMVFVEGRDLRQILREYNDRREIMPMADVLNVVRGIGSALDYAHSRGVIHRDVKPSNIMLNPENRAILTDFGLALNASEGTLGETFGSAHYIAPEQAVSSAKAVPQSDLYSLGICTYEMLTGKVPFDDPSAMSVALKHLQDLPPPPSLYNANLSSAVEHVVLRVLDKDPAHRYNTGAELAQALQSAVDNEQLADTSKLSVIEIRALQAATSRPDPLTVTTSAPPPDDTLPPTSPRLPDPLPPSIESLPSIPPPPIALSPSTFIAAPSVAPSTTPRRFGLLPLLVVLILIIGGTYLAGRAAGLIGVVSTATVTGTPSTGTPGTLIAALPINTLPVTEAISTSAVLVPLTTIDPTLAATDTAMTALTSTAMPTLPATATPSDAPTLRTPMMTSAATISPPPLLLPSASPTLASTSDTSSTLPATSTVNGLDVTLSSVPSQAVTLAATTAATANVTLPVTASATVSATAPATSAATLAAVGARADVLLIYDKDQFNLINETTHPISIKNIVFVQHSTPERRFSAQSWTIFLPSLTALPPQDCFQSSRSTVQQVPAIRECARIMAYWSAGDPTQFWIAATANATASFDVQINGVTVTTCAIPNGRCQFALPN